MKGQTKILHETTTTTLEHIDGVYSSVRNFSYIIDLIHTFFFIYFYFYFYFFIFLFFFIHTKTNTRYLLHSDEAVLLEHPLVIDPSVWLRQLYGTLFLLASAASNVFLLLSLILKLIFLN